jgi:hypothetical protein
MNYNYNYRPVQSEYVPINNNYSYMSGPLEANGKSWKEVRNEQAKLAAPPVTKLQNTRALKRMNGKRNVFTRRRKNRRN